MSDQLISLASWLEKYGIVAMVAVFTLIFVTTYLPARKDTVERHGRIPLDDDR